MPITCVTKWHFTGLVNTICHQISLNSWGLCSTNEPLISLFNFLFLNHSHFLLSSWHSVSYTNCPCSTFSFHFFNQFSFFCFLLAMKMLFSKLSSATAVLTRALLLCVTHFARLQFSSLTESSTPTRPLPLSILHM